MSRYEIERKIGRGAYGKVFLVVDKKDNSRLVKQTKIAWKIVEIYKEKQNSIIKKVRSLSQIIEY